MKHIAAKASIVLVLGLAPPSNCNGTCPGTLACTGDLQNASSVTVAKNCQ